jgi:hypothetical protein
MSITPSIAVTLALNPPNFTLGTNVELSVTAVSNASYPITVFTWPHIFNLDLAQKRGNFKGVDRDTGMELPMHDIRMSRMEYDHTLGGPDDENHVMLEPGQPFKLNSPFSLAYGPPMYSDATEPRSGPEEK